jgi:hypothetical protein
MQNLTRQEGYDSKSKNKRMRWCCLNVFKIF